MEMDWLTGWQLVGVGGCAGGSYWGEVGECFRRVIG